MKPDRLLDVMGCVLFVVSITGFAASLLSVGSGGPVFALCAVINGWGVVVTGRYIHTRWFWHG